MPEQPGFKVLSNLGFKRKAIRRELKKEGEKKIKIKKKKEKKELCNRKII